MSKHVLVRIAEGGAVEEDVNVLCMWTLGCHAVLHTERAVADHVAEVCFPMRATCVVADREDLEN